MSKTFEGMYRDLIDKYGRENLGLALVTCDVCSMPMMMIAPTLDISGMLHLCAACVSFEAWGLDEYMDRDQQLRATEARAARAAFDRIADIYREEE